MKVQLQRSLEFEPVHMQVTIESETELVSLYHRLNIADLPDSYKRDYGLNRSDKVEATHTLKLYHIIKAICQNKGIVV
jgi:hypothetical protein